MVDRNGRRVKATLLVAASLAAGPALADSFAPAGDLEEQVTDAAQVSMSRVVVGVVSDSTPRASDARVEAAVAPEWRGDTICARFLSADSTYEGSREYAIPETFRDVVGELDFPTAHADALDQLTTSEFTVAVTRGDCDRESMDFAVALWRSDSYDASESVLVLINAQGADESYVYLPDRDADAPCTAIGHGHAVGFDHVCRIPRDDLPESGPVAIEVNRATGGSFEEPERLTLWLPETH
jgi:hypothetical protein